MVAFGFLGLVDHAGFNDSGSKRELELFYLFQFLPIKIIFRQKKSFKRKVNLFFPNEELSLKNEELSLKNLIKNYLIKICIKKIIIRSVFQLNSN